MSILFLSTGFFAITLFGYLLVKIFDQEIGYLEGLSLGYLIGLGLFTEELFLLNLAGISLTLSNANLILAISLSFVLLIHSLIHKSFLPRQPELKFPKLTLIQKTLFLAVAILGVTSLVTDLYWPVKDWDALVLYDFRAKVFAQSGSIQKAVDVMTASNFIGYPLLTSLAHAYVYLTGFSNPIFIYALFYISFIGVAFSVLRKFSSLTKSLFFSLILVVCPLIFDHSTMAYTNLPYSIYLVLGTFYLYLWSRFFKVSYLIISAFLIGLSTWTRTTEPFWLVGLLIVGIFSLFFWVQKMNYKLSGFKKINRGFVTKIFLGLIGYYLIFFSIQIPWRIFALNHNYGLVLNPIDQVSGGASVLVDPSHQQILFKVIEYIFKFTFLPNWPIFLAFLAGFGYQLLAKKNLALAIIVWGYLGLMILGTYIFAASYPGWEEIHGSLERLSMFLGPLLVFFLAAA